ncbi:MAG: esterase/lipase family protein [Ardenticatenaceae bacterium]
MSRPVPILLIHGYNGEPVNWTAFRTALITRGADPDLIRVFHYGWLEELTTPVESTGPSLAQRAPFSHPASTSESLTRRYNNWAGIHEIAARLGRRDTSDPVYARSQLVRLSEASVARGGPAKVTIVAHSMGGLVARYYLSRQTPDERGTVNEGVVGRLITIATPHLGVEFARILQLIPRDAFIWHVLRWLEKLPFVRGEPMTELLQLESQVEALQASVLAAEFPVAAQGYLDSLALRQMTPGSEFLEQLNRPGTFPPDVEAALLWGDVRLAATVRWGALTLWGRAITLGDLLVPASSASTLPHATPTCLPFTWAREFEVQVGERAVAPYNLMDFLPPVAHSNLLYNADVHAAVARLVGL